jgi:hypothetical protein
MVDDRRALPPRLLRYDLQVSDQLPDVAKLIIVADDGKHVFLVNSAGLTNIAAASLTTATTLSAAVAKRVAAKN